MLKIRFKTYFNTCIFLQKGEKNMLKKLRQERGLTHEQLAKKLGISKSYYVKIENDFMKPSYKVLKKLKDFYGEDINLNELFK